MKTVVVENIRPVDAGNLKAFASIMLGGKVRINDVRVIQQPGQRAWVSMPARSYEKDGQRKWAPIVELMDGPLKGQISNAVLEEFERLAYQGALASGASF
jgi:DNA-binding cell septation regulator SpoVG